MLDLSQHVDLCDRHHQLRRVPLPCVPLLDIVVLGLLAGSLLYDLARALSHLDRRGYSSLDASERHTLLSTVYLTFAMM